MVTRTTRRDVELAFRTKNVEAFRSLWEKEKFLPFKEARDFVRELKIKRKLKFKNVKEWKAYSKSGKKPLNIPVHPEKVYKIWIDWPDWLGYAPKRANIFKSFKRARAFARNLKLRNCTEWRVYCKSGKRPFDIPFSPNYYYKEWINWSDWLGTTPLLSFKKARSYVRKLKIKNEMGWTKYSRSIKKPLNIPATPRHAYRKEWISMFDWLGNKKEFRPFKGARTFARKQKIKDGLGWDKFCKSINKPINIPKCPWKVYKEWVDLYDWLGKTRKGIKC